MKLWLYILFSLHSLLLLGLTFVAFRQSGDFKYFNPTNRKLSYVFAGVILIFWILSVIVLFAI